QQMAENLQSIAGRCRPNIFSMPQSFPSTRRAQHGDHNFLAPFFVECFVAQYIMDERESVVSLISFEKFTKEMSKCASHCESFANTCEELGGLLGMVRKLA